MNETVRKMRTPKEPQRQRQEGRHARSAACCPTLHGDRRGIHVHASSTEGMMIRNGREAWRSRPSIAEVLTHRRDRRLEAFRHPPSGLRHSRELAGVYGVQHGVLRTGRHFQALEPCNCASTHTHTHTQAHSCASRTALKQKKRTNA